MTTYELQTELMEEIRLIPHDKLPELTRFIRFFRLSIDAKRTHHTEAGAFLRFGEFGGDEASMSTIDDFKIAEVKQSEKFREAVKALGEPATDEEFAAYFAGLAE